MSEKVIVVGGGASGLTAAIAAARNGASVTILERTSRVGKKILSTGNGKCNLTNRYIGRDCYRSMEADFPMKVIDLFPPEDAIRFFESLGIVIKDKNGYIYPASLQASSVLDLLRMEAEHLHINIVCDCRITKIKHRISFGFQVETDDRNKKYQSDALILAAGSKAAPGTGSDGSGYELAKAMGHTIIKPLPALVQLRCKERWYKQLAGVRADAGVALFINGKKAASDTGELQLTDYGISGIPVFQISRFASIALDQEKAVEARIDFFPGMEKEELHVMLQRRKEDFYYRRAEEFFTGMLNKKLSLVILECGGIKRDRLVSDLRDSHMERLVLLLKEFKTEVTKSNGFEQAQVCCGGVDTREVDFRTLESKKQKGLYLVGELLDVDGICGGYNLQWAFSTGAIAGREAGKTDD